MTMKHSSPPLCLKDERNICTNIESKGMAHLGTAIIGNKESLCLHMPRVCGDIFLISGSSIVDIPHKQS